MSRLSLPQPTPAPTDRPAAGSAADVAPLAPLLVDINGLAVLLCRSVASLHRDDAAGRLPAALWIGGSKRWRVRDINAWVEQDCPPRDAFQARQDKCR